MKERPILFTGEMVRAILEGRKTQTRRVMKIAGRRGEGWAGQVLPANQSGWIAWWPGNMKDLADLTKQWYEHGFECPYGLVGDRLWVRETWKPGAWNEDGEIAVDYKASPEITHTPWINYPGDGFADFHQRITDEVLATGLQSGEDGYFHWEPGKSPLKWRPSIFMPRWASRIALEITGIRVQRVQEISEKDALAEGIAEGFMALDTVSKYAFLWSSINAKRGYGWDVNPWVWVVEFQVVK